MNKSDSDTDLEYPSMEEGASERQSELNRLKFDAGCAKDEARQLAERKANRLWQLEQDLIRRQGGVTNLPGDALEKWIKNNPEEYAKYEARWDREDKGLEQQRIAQHGTGAMARLYDSNDGKEWRKRDTQKGVVDKLISDEKDFAKYGNMAALYKDMDD